ncbi:aminopeptidase N [Marmoricola endophyticus]|uniref:Aminopeptidase N n=1 Tax=Marmoricola endophyticus TaxID=2040280 RepID=A0A917BW51_9ACTN|nr:aminopeptidase N [Marmoricola endophyticus]GGF57937.1 aminopeptidase N [Marmoricola endophyticus]
MPGTNLTREEAQTRAALLSVDSYTVELDLTTGPDTFGSRTTIEFTATDGASTFADLDGASSVREITLNGTALDPGTSYDGARISLEGLAASNTLVVHADLPYSHTGEGLHRFVDPVDDRVYTYSQFEVPDARKVYTTFEQPDLKSVFTFVVTTPEGWVVSSNSPSPDPEAIGGGKERHTFAPTQTMSTYVTAVVAGEYHVVRDTYEGDYGTVPLGHYCRQSLVEHFDTDELNLITKQGFALFEGAFGMAYPFGKYDQLYVPEYNMGAMENAGCVTFRDEYLPRGRQPRSFYANRANTILHEMAHMWFGDLVTMKWWDDLWLNESFAEWAAYYASSEATQYDDAWTGFTNARKVTGYRQDQLPSTHPIAADNYDLEAVEVNFDMITYAKGASVLKQLVAWVGIEEFLAGLRQYFAAHAYGNSEFTDLLSALETSSGRELAGWAKEWLQTAGVNTLTPEVEVDESGTITRLTVRQSAAADWPTLRRHRLGIGFYDLGGGSSGELTRRTYLETDVEGEATEVAEAVGEKQPDLLLLNDEDLAYAKIRLDERSQSTAVEHLSALTESLPRALVWGAAWDQTRDAEMAARDFVTLFLANIGAETDAWGLSRIPSYAAQAVGSLSDPAGRPALRERFETEVRALADAAEPGSDHQLTFVRTWAGSAHSDAALDDLEGLLSGSVAFDGLDVDQDLRWLLVTELAANGRFTETEIAAEEKRDGTISGREKAAGARAAQPLVEAKAAAWKAAMEDPSTPNETQRTIAGHFHQHGQEEVLEPYVQKYLDAVATSWEKLGAKRAATALGAMFPRVLASAELLDRVDAWLADTEVNPGARRYVEEGRADVARYLAAQERDGRA